MKKLFACAVALLWFGLAAAPLARADVITDWNDVATSILHPTGNTLIAYRHFTMMHVAQFDAVNAIVGKYTPYLVNVAAPGASPEAAAAQAAHDVLLRLWPTNQTLLDGALSNSLASVPNGPAKTDGITLGASVANQILNLRASDASALPILNPFPLLTSSTNYPTGQGYWAATPGGSATPAGPQYAYVTPWALRSSSMFRPGPPPSLSNAIWTADFNEMKSLGATNSTTRTADQTDIGLYIIEFSAYVLDSALKQIVATHPMSLVDTARAYTLLHMAGADAIIAVWEAKYAYDFWRPVTAIRTADTNINPATVPDPNWLPLRTTPSHPEYPCAHCSDAGAMTTVMSALFGDNVTFTFESPTLPGKPRTFNKFSDYAQLTLEGRLYSGFHFRNSSMVGLDLGRKVGAYVVKNVLTPGATLEGQLQAGQFRLATRNLGTDQLQIQFSDDLQNWQPLTNVLRTDSILQLVDPNAGNPGHRFYRAVSE